MNGQAGQNAAQKRTFEHRRDARKRSALGAYPEIKPNLIDSYDERAILVDKRPSSALLVF